MDTFKKGVKLLQTDADPNLSTPELMLINDDLQPGRTSEN